VLDLRLAAQFARDRIKKRLESAGSSKRPPARSVAVVQQGSSFRVHLTEALRRGGDEQSPSTAPVSLFMAFPEKLLAKWYYLAYGPQRDEKGDSARHPVEAEWRSWDKLGGDAAIVNFAPNLKAVLVAHGLSAIDDSILLLADLGRAFRASRVLNVPVQVLLAGTNWISYNLSLKKFDLTEAQIESGLRACQERRLRLCEALRARVTVHEIVGYAQKGGISKTKIRTIADRYVELAGIIWGEDNIDTPEPLLEGSLKNIGRPLQISIGEKSPLRPLGRFPGALQALEQALKPHLSVVRTMAQRFRLLSLDTFSYYFAQFYAQDGYRGTHLKIAAMSERSFDKPFDELDDSFRSWGDGHEPEVSGDPRKTGRRKRLAAVYLPQYTLGDWELLPYTPLSLTAVAKADGKIDNLKDRVILLSDSTLEHRTKIEELLRATRVKATAAGLNRLLYDVLSFVQAVVIARGWNAVNSTCRKLGQEFDDVLLRINKSLPQFSSIECEESAVFGDLCLSWLDAIDRDSPPDYVPCHILLATLTEAD
jgi:hypothetical protein